MHQKPVPAPETTPVASELPPLHSLWNFRDVPATEARFRALLPQAEASGNQGYLGELYTQIARTQGLQQNFDGALATLEQAELLVHESRPTVEVRVLLERGRALNSSGQAPASLPLFERALAVAQAAGLEYYAVDAAHMLGIAHEPGEALAWNERALALAEAATDERARKWRGSLLNNLGWTYHALGRHEDALGMFDRHLVLLTEAQLTFRMSIATWARGKMLRFLGRLPEALAIQEALLDHPERQGNDGEGYTREELGECLLALERAEEARPHFARAWELLHENAWLKRDEPERLARLARLGGVSAAPASE